MLTIYRYDPLDRLVGGESAIGVPIQRFYCKSRLAIEIEGAITHRIFEGGDQILAQQRHSDHVVDAGLLTTTLSGSVLHIQSIKQQQTIAYTSFGHSPVESRLSSLLGFNGERFDRLTGHYLLGNGYRAFNPVLMRFNSPDSMSPFDAGGVNSYAINNGDPINFIDPSGHVVRPVGKSFLRGIVSSNYRPADELVFISSASRSIKKSPVIAHPASVSGVPSGDSIKTPVAGQNLNSYQSSSAARSFGPVEVQVPGPSYHSAVPANVERQIDPNVFVNKNQYGPGVKEETWIDIYNNKYNPPDLPYRLAGKKIDSRISERKSALKAEGIKNIYKQRSLRAVIRLKYYNNDARNEFNAWRKKYDRVRRGS